MYDLPSCFQVRKDCIVAYTDYSSIVRTSSNEKIVSSGSYSSSAKRRFEKYLKLWSYSIVDTHMKFSFVTLTLSSKMDISINYTLLLKKLLEKLAYRYGDFNYCWKIEFQKNGNLHFHLILDFEVDWKIVRKQWNKLQSKHVDEYQTKMKHKYKNGYFYDTEMVNNKGTIIDEETQKKRFEIGNKANWRNPNSTDVAIVDCINGIDGYVSKYVSKNESNNDNVNSEHKIKRFFGCSDSLRQLKYLTLNESELCSDTINELRENTNRSVLNNDGRFVCSIIKNIDNEYIKTRESEVKAMNLEVLKSNSVRKLNRLVQKELNLYEKLYN